MYVLKRYLPPLLHQVHEGLLSGLAHALQSPREGSFSAQKLRDLEREVRYYNQRILLLSIEGCEEARMVNQQTRRADPTC
jgi:hypothetical protein